MATRGTPIPAATIRHIQSLRQVLSVRQTARLAGVDTKTVLKYAQRSGSPGKRFG